MYKGTTPGQYRGTAGSPGSIHAGGTGVRKPFRACFAFTSAFESRRKAPPILTHRTSRQWFPRACRALRLGPRRRLANLAPLPFQEAVLDPQQKQIDNGQTNEYPSLVTAYNTSNMRSISRSMTTHE
jgi:hypothetical protein